ncbi:hypothetical protein K8I85_04155 [bacterium]|nr:hypothetical protein [bacterium]
MPRARDPVRSHVRRIALLIATTAFAVHGVRLGEWVGDDAFIFLRYADHPADGSGPVYNPGECVDGYTSFLYVVLLAGGRTLGAPRTGPDCIRVAWASGIRACVLS